MTEAVRYVDLSDAGAVEALDDGLIDLCREVRRVFAVANAWMVPEHQQLRAYQDDILSGLGFLLRWKYDAVPQACVGTLYTTPKGYAYCFVTGRGRVWLVTNGFAWGYQLELCFLERESLCLHLRRFHEPFRVVEIQKAVALAAPAKRAATRLRIVAGHTNFAHTWYNELPALMLVESRLDKVDRVDVIHDTFGPLMEYLDVPAGTHVHASHEGRGGCVEQRAFYEEIVFTPGCEVFTRAARQRVRERLPRTADDAGGLVVLPGEVLVWMSVRAINRTPRNQIDGLLCILGALAELPFGTVVFLDGYSEPNDLLVDGRHDVRRQVTSRNTTMESAAELACRYAAVCRPNVRLVDGTPYDLVRSLAATRQVEFYFCHHGTQQHKLAWLRDVPGVVHANRAVLQSRPANWVRLHSEGSVQPTYLPPDLVGEVAPRDEYQTRRPLWGDYEFADLPRLAAFVIDTMRVALPHRWPA